MAGIARGYILPCLQGHWGGENCGGEGTKSVLKKFSFFTVKTRPLVVSSRSATSISTAQARKRAISEVTPPQLSTRSKVRLSLRHTFCSRLLDCGDSLA